MALSRYEIFAFLNVLNVFVIVEKSSNILCQQNLPSELFVIMNMQFGASSLSNGQPTIKNPSITEFLNRFKHINGYRSSNVRIIFYAFPTIMKTSNYLNML